MKPGRARRVSTLAAMAASNQKYSWDVIFDHQPVIDIGLHHRGIVGDVKGCLVVS